MAQSKRLFAKRTVEARQRNGTYVRIEITVAANSLELTKAEQHIVLDNLADHAMTALADAPYVAVPINRQRVRG